MATQTEIEEMIARGELEAAAEAAAQFEEPLSCYLLGRIAWKQGDRRRAIALYNRSAAADPTGSGAVALEQSRAIMDFYNKDLLNP